MDKQEAMKYMFRFYGVDKDGNYFSPHVKKESDLSGIDIDETGGEHDEGTPYSSFWHKGEKYTPTTTHFGHSGIGKIDPNYSLFSADYDNTDLETLFGDEGKDMAHSEITSQIPKEAVNTMDLEKYYENNEENDYEFLCNKEYPLQYRLKMLAKYIKDEDTKDVNTMSISPENFKFAPETDSKFNHDDYLYDNLVDRLTEYSKEPKYKDTSLHIVAMPESALVTTDDVVNEGLITQRDSPNEIVSRQIERRDKIDDIKAAKEQYDELRAKGLGGNVAFSRVFKVDGEHVVSDVNKKKILTDFKNDYKGIQKQRNILKGVKKRF